MRTTFVKSLAMATIGSLLMVGGVMATPLLQIESGSVVKIVGDNLLAGSTVGDFLTTDADFVSINGVVLFIGGVADWDIDVSTGYTMPANGTATAPAMHLASSNYTSSTPVDAITVQFSEIGFGPISEGLDGFITGLSANGPNPVLQSLKVYYSTSNKYFALDNLIGSISSSGLGSDSDIFSDIAELVGTSPFSLTMVATVNHTAGGQVSSFDASVAPVPEPATMILLGTGLISLAGMARKRKQK